MPKLTKALPKYRKHRASGQAIVTLDGKDRYLGPHGTATSHREYDRLIAEYLANGRRPACPEDDPEETLVVEVLSAFWQHAKIWYRKNGEPTSEVGDFKRIIRLVKRLYGDKPVSDFGPLALKAVRQVWIESGHTRPTVNKNTGRLKHLFKWAVSEELVPSDVYQALRTVEGLRKGRCECPEPEPVKPVDLRIVEKTIPHLPQVTADMVRFQLLTGARPGEVCTMTPGDIDRDDDVWEYFVDGHKTEHHGRTRIIIIGPQAQALLTPYLDRDDDVVCFAMAESLEQRRTKASSTRVTPLSCGNRRGKRSKADRQERKNSRKARFEFDTSSYYKAICSACDNAFPAPPPLAQESGESKAARLRRLDEAQQERLTAWQRDHRWAPNQLRHTRATDIRKKYGLEAAQVILGHACADVTQIYAERDLEKAREVMREAG